MAVCVVNVTIKGTSALLMHRHPLVDVEGLEKKSAADQAEHSAYRDSATGVLHIPGTCIWRSMVNAAAYSKGKGRATLQKTAAACLSVTPEIVTLGVKDYVIDSRMVVIPATKGHVVRHRPRLDEWGCSFVLSYDDILLKETEARRILDDAGLRVGILDFRPERKGPFGRFMVTSWTPEE